ncbi:hypothetical protein D0860_07028 [Hortaea werneckii]|uniref:X8 domain-containing protein n=1 Tax=Hortaea werneckii TaxID=91943 RepID=A0A3M7GQE0_HORWE|nr:hypothetical protein D0860_07028 [Hortaea werneckii]
MSVNVWTRFNTPNDPGRATSYHCVVFNVLLVSDFPVWQGHDVAADEAVFSNLYSATSYGSLAANATTGEYGAYSMCDSTEQMAFVLNQYYQAQDSSNKASACNFDGSASIKSTQAPGATCSSLLQMAGSAGTNSVSVQPSVTGAGAASSETGGSGSDSNSSGSFRSSSGAMTAVPSVEFGILPVTFMAAAAAVSGFGMLLLQGVH